MQYSVMNKHFILHADKFYDVRGISHVYQTPVFLIYKRIIEVKGSAVRKMDKNMLDVMFHPISNVQQGNLVLESFGWISNLT